MLTNLLMVRKLLHVFFFKSENWHNTQSLKIDMLSLDLECLGDVIVFTVAKYVKPRHKSPDYSADCCLI